MSEAGLPQLTGAIEAGYIEAMSDDEITMKRLLRLEEEVDELRERVTAASPTLALDAVASLRSDSAERFERLTARMDERFDAVDVQLAAILNAIKGRLS